jgi:probable HAF family extracellular repeat protein
MSHARRYLATLAAVLILACAESGTPTSPAIEQFDAVRGAAGSPGITIVELGTLGGSSSAANAVNDEGRIVGSSEAPGGGTHGFLWADGVMTDLGTLAGMTGSVAYDINEGGQIVGVSYDVGASRAFVWSAGVMQELPLPPGYCCSQALAISDDGLVAGSVSVAGGHPHVAIWRDGVPIDLQPSGTREGYAWDVNNAGQVVGTLYSDFGSGVRQGSFTWTEDSGLQLLDGTADGGEALAINDAAQIVGHVSSVAYLRENGVREPLGTLGGSYSVALGINDASPVQIVGSSNGSKPRRGSSNHAFIWTESRGMQDLGLPKGKSAGRAEDVNGTGWAVGWTTTPGGTDRATLWKVSTP